MQIQDTRAGLAAARREGLLAAGEVKDHAELARVAGISRARVTQTQNLLHLAPDIQEELLHLPRTLVGRDPVTERDLRRVAAEPLWGGQRAMWRGLARAAEGTPSR